MSSPLTRKLSSFIDLAEKDCQRLDSLCSSARPMAAGQALIHEGDRPEDVFLLVEGWAYRYKMLPDGRRQILAYLVPGDLCDIHVFILRKMDHGIGLLSDAKVAAVRKETILSLIRDHPDIGQALFWATLVDEAILREWVMNIGQRDAYERIAHLFCEMWMRMDQVGLVSGDEFSLPITQEQLADMVGLTTVHVNRVLQRLRMDGLISLSGKYLTIHDVDHLKAIAIFNPNYLHLDRRREPASLM
jgi:CRP-like cAMP-binding protein